MTTEIKLSPFEQIPAMMLTVANVRQNVQQAIAPYQEGFDRIASVVAAINEFQDDLRQNIQRWVTEHQESIEQTLKQISVGVANYERYIKEQEPEIIKIFAQAGWLGINSHFTFEDLQTVVYICKTQGEGAMNEAISDYFNANECARLVVMAEHWSKIPYLQNRQAIVNDALSAHRIGQFTLSIPALLPFAEGLCAEILGGTDRTDAVKRVAKALNITDEERWMRIFSDVVLEVIYENYHFGSDIAPYLTRHGILHGRVFDYASKTNSTRVFLLIDLVADLWREKQRASKASN